MEVFSSVDDLARVLGGHVKWRRTEEALRRARSAPTDVASSLGDSLTYWVQEVRAEDRFTAHRRYLTVLHPLDGGLDVEVADVADLTPLDAYSDLADRQHLAGSGEAVTLRAGSVGVVGTDGAYRFLADGPARLVVVRVTVEGASFHNK